MAFWVPVLSSFLCKSPLSGKEKSNCELGIANFKMD
jgi:hypothetical protein